MIEYTTNLDTVTEKMLQGGFLLDGQIRLLPLRT
jgi:hypothetical protein